MTGRSGAGKVRPLAVMAKPVGSACNMRCGYCYYLETLPGAGTGIMSHEVLERLIREYIAAAPGPAVSFTWHGGEPTLAGIDFYREAVRLQKQFLPEGWECWNSLQTNGLALDEEWCRFLAEAHFDVGLSIDGTRAVHDAFRRDPQGRGTWERVREAARLLCGHGLRPDLLCTVNARTVEEGVRVYQALREMETGWIQFIPIVRRDESGRVTPDSVSPEAYGRFLKEVFSQWLYHDLEKTQVQLFSEMALVLSGREAGLCWMRPVCGEVPVVEKDGSVYACDHFVRMEYRVGSLGEEGLGRIVSGSAQRGFGEKKKTGLTGTCRACPWLPLCSGGCPKDRFAVSPAGEAGQYFLCGGLRDFYGYAVPRLREAMRLSALGRSQREIMDELIRQEREKWSGIARNDPCPCGSGKKAKQCCLRLCP